MFVSFYITVWNISEIRRGKDDYFSKKNNYKIIENVNICAFKIKSFHTKMAFLSLNGMPDLRFKKKHKKQEMLYFTKSVKFAVSMKHRYIFATWENCR